MRRLESDTVLDSVFATDTNPVLPVPVISQHLTLASVLLIRRALGGRYNNVGIRAASSPGPPLSRTASGPDIPSGSCRSAVDKWMGERHIRNGLYFYDLQYPQIGLPLVAAIQRIMIRAQILRQAATSNRVIEHPAQSRTVYCSPMDPKPNDPPRQLVHHDQDPMGCQRCRFAAEQITTPQAVLHMVEKCQPRWAGIRIRPVVKAQDSANYVLIDLEAKSQSNRLGDSRIASAGIPPFPLNNSSDEFLT